jgi:hypothetical protein
MAKRRVGSANERVLEQLLALLSGGQAHASFEDAVRDFPEELRGKTPRSLPYSAWQLVEHLRIAQRDILKYSDNARGGYKAMKWPDDYWPKQKAPADAKAWAASIRAIQRDRRTFEKLLTAKGADLYAPFAWGSGQNLLRQALLLADHNAYHVGEIVMLRRLLGCWR